MSDGGITNGNTSDGGKRADTNRPETERDGVTVQGPSDDEAAATQGFGGGDPTAGTGGEGAAGAGDTTVGDGDTIVDDDEADVPTGHQASEDAATEVDRGAQGRMRE